MDETEEVETPTQKTGQRELFTQNNRVQDIMKIKSDDLIYICGMRRTGKSYLLDRLIDQMPRFVIYDGATHQHGSKGVVVRTADELDKAMKNGQLKIVCQPWHDGEKIFDEFCKTIWDNGNCMFAVEEIGNYMDSFSCSENADMLIRVGRNRGIGMIGINQRPARIWLNFIALVDHWFVFRCMLPDDVKFLCQYLGKEREQGIKELEKRYFYYMDSDEMKPIKCNPI